MDRVKFSISAHIYVSVYHYVSDEQGRFTQEDTYYGDGLNLYQYCQANPVGYVDPSGHNCEIVQNHYEQYQEYRKQHPEATATSQATTHIMGNFAAKNGYTGLIVPSARADGGVNIVIFNPKKVEFGTYTTIHERW